jgi:hypothetical protein
LLSVTLVEKVVGGVIRRRAGYATREFEGVVEVTELLRRSGVDFLEISKRDADRRLVASSGDDGGGG